MLVGGSRAPPAAATKQPYVTYVVRALAPRSPPGPPAVSLPVGLVWVLDRSISPVYQSRCQSQNNGPATAPSTDERKCQGGQDKQKAEKKLLRSSPPRFPPRPHFAPGRQLSTSNCQQHAPVKVKRASDLFDMWTFDAISTLTLEPHEGAAILISEASASPSCRRSVGAQVWEGCVLVINTQHSRACHRPDPAPADATIADTANSIACPLFNRHQSRTLAFVIEESDH